MQALLSELDNFYWDNLLSVIENKVADYKRKGDIILLARTFITEAEFQGFSRGYIHYKTLGFFFKPDVFPKKIHGTEQIKDFLISFNQAPSNWHVVFRGSNDFQRMVESAQYHSLPNLSLTISSDIPADIAPEIVNRHRFLTDINLQLPLFLSVNINEDIGIRESRSARNVAKESIDVLSDIHSFVAHHEQSNISDEALVINKKTNDSSVLQPSPNPMKCGIQRQSEEDAKSIIELFIDIVNAKHFDNSSSRLITKSLDFHRAALEAKTPENQLLDLWAALEGFLPSPSEDGARVVHYIKTLVPSLTLTYPEKIFQYLADSIYHGGGKCREIVNSVEVGDNFFEKVSALVVCNDLTDKRTKLYSELSEHVLLRHRIYEIHEAFKSKKNIKDTILFHRKWITWHIQRIYTTRNQIIHNADSLPYLRTLVENLHSYFDILVETTSVVSYLSKTRLSISSALDILVVHEQGYLSVLEGDDEDCTTNNYINLVFGLENPIAPFNSGISFY